MSKNTQGYMGTQQGKLGPAVGYKYRGQQTYRAYIKDVRNPRTQKQQLNRAIFGAASKLSRALAPVSAIGLRHMADIQNIHHRNLFMHLNKTALSATSPDNITTDYSALQLADGGATPVLFGAPQFDAPATVSASFNPLSETPGANSDDLVYLAAYNPALHMAIVGTPAKRSSRSASVALPSAWTGDSVHVYGFTRTPDHQTWNNATQSWMPADMPSPSSYLGQGEVG